VPFLFAARDVRRPSFDSIRFGARIDLTVRAAKVSPAIVGLAHVGTGRVAGSLRVQNSVGLNGLPSNRIGLTIRYNGILVFNLFKGAGDVDLVRVPVG
jgi:hypothetical protein